MALTIFLVTFEWSQCFFFLFFYFYYYYYCFDSVDLFHFSALTKKRRCFTLVDQMRPWLCLALAVLLL